MEKVLCIGDVMLDVIAVIKTKINYGSDTPSKISTHGGGAAGNVASWASSSGASTRIVARVGNDSAGTAVLSEFDALGIAYSNAIIPGAQTGVVIVLVDTSGERTMFPETGANSGLSLADLPSLEGVEVVYLSGYALLDPVSRPGVLEMIAKITEAGVPIFFDPATVGGMSEVNISEVRSWLPLMSALFMNEEEATFLTGETKLEPALNSLLRDAPLVVIKRGSQGAIGKVRGGESIIIPAVPTQVIDTTGAGDSFAGGYIASWIRSPDLLSCMEAGAETAGHCVSIVGARPHVTPAL
ncbi:MAG: carbohydrate kinase family protein [Candidatus Nanopelagicaceae bacterium]|nr:carbohydrate kinase family protein [Candidatus Nanopelagicaceae bacterium]